MSTEMEVLNTKSGELVTANAPTPEELLLAAREAARALKSVIDSNDRPPVSFNGKQYLEYPHWQTIAKFYHCSVATEGAEFVEIQGVPGFKAKAKVIDEKTGLLIGSAEAFCMRDEPNWKNKPYFQLASMAQTRAGSKALANKFRYVAIVAGYEPTPKEEMDGVELKPTVQMPKAKGSPPKTENAEPLDGSEIHFGSPEDVQKVMGGKIRKPITEAQRKMLFAKSKTVGVPEHILRAYLKDTFGTDHTSELYMDEVDKCVQWIERYANATKT